MKFNWNFIVQQHKDKYLALQCVTFVMLEKRQRFDFRSKSFVLNFTWSNPPLRRRRKNLEYVHKCLRIKTNKRVLNVFCLIINYLITTALLMAILVILCRLHAITKIAIIIAAICQ